MRYVRLVLRYAAALMAAMASVFTTLVWEGGRWVSKLLRAAAAGPQQEAVAEAELDAEVEALQAETKKPAVLVTDTLADLRDYGLAAMAYVTGDERQRAAAVQRIDPAAAEYLDSLSLADTNKLLARDPASIARHLVGERHLPGLPVPMSLQQHLERTTERLAADTAELRRVVEESKRQREREREREREGQQCIADALADLVANPQWYPKRAA